MNSTNEQTTIGDFDINEVMQHYFAALLFATTDDDGAPLDDNYSADDISAELRESTRSDIIRFLTAHHEQCATWQGERGNCSSPEQQTGHDLFFTRCGHGVGFWESEWRHVGDILTDGAKQLGEIWPYVGDDGKIYG